MPCQFGADDAKLHQMMPKVFWQLVVQHGIKPEDSGVRHTSSFQIGLKRTLKSMLYKLMAKCATSCVCELRPALNVPTV
jgi:hypothetical protein